MPESRPFGLIDHPQPCPCNACRFLRLHVRFEECDDVWITYCDLWPSGVPFYTVEAALDGIRIEESLQQIEKVYG